MSDHNLSVAVKPLDDDQIMEIIKEVAPWKDEPKLNDLLTYEKSPPLFPQATYDVPSYRATKFVRAVEQRIRSALVAPPAQEAVDLGYGQKLIAEAIEAHFGDRDDAYRYELGDTTLHDVWNAFEAITAAQEGR